MFNSNWLINIELWLLDDTNNSVTREHEVKFIKISQLIGDDKLSIYVLEFKLPIKTNKLQ